MITGRTSRTTRTRSTGTRAAWSPVLFVVALIVGLFAFAPTASACTHDIVIHKAETGVLAPGGTYEIRVTGLRFERTVSVVAGGSTTITGVAPGVYEFEELGHPDAVIEPNPLLVTSEGSNGDVVDVYVTNHYPGARLAIAKVETGSAAPAASHTFDITGSDITGPGNDPVTLTATVAAGTTWTSDWLPLGTYTITERNAPTGHTITPNPVTLDTDEQTVTVTATNPYRDRHARLAITKIETGSAAPGGTHTFDITGSDITGPAELTATVAAGTTWTSDWLPLGTYTITERNAPTGHTITPNPVTLDTDEQTVTVTATNPYLAARLAIQKVQAGTAGVGATYTFEVHGPVTFNVQVAAGTTWTSELLPLGTYTVTERNAPAGHTIVPAAAVLSADGSTVTVVATNPAVLSESSPPARLPATGAATDELALLAGFVVATGGLLAAAGHRRRDA